MVPKCPPGKNVSDIEYPIKITMMIGIVRNPHTGKKEKKDDKKETTPIIDKNGIILG